MSREEDTPYREGGGGADDDDGGGAHPPAAASSQEEEGRSHYVVEHDNDVEDHSPRHPPFSNGHASSSGGGSHDNHYHHHHHQHDDNQLDEQQQQQPPSQQDRSYDHPDGRGTAAERSQDDNYHAYGNYSNNHPPRGSMELAPPPAAEYHPNHPTPSSESQQYQERRPSSSAGAAPDSRYLEDDTRAPSSSAPAGGSWRGQHPRYPDEEQQQHQDQYPNGGGGESLVRPIFLGNLYLNYATENVIDMFERPFQPRSDVTYPPIPVDHIDVKRGYCFVFLKPVYQEAFQMQVENYVADIKGMEVPRVSQALRAEFARGDGKIKNREEKRRKNIEPSETLFVVNFHERRTQRRDLEDIFGRYGELVRIDMKKNFAFIQFRTIREATIAKENTQGLKLMDSALTVEYVAKDRNSGRRGSGDGGMRGRSGERDYYPRSGGGGGDSWDRQRDRRELRPPSHQMQRYDDRAPVRRYPSDVVAGGGGQWPARGDVGVRDDYYDDRRRGVPAPPMPGGSRYYDEPDYRRPLYRRRSRSRSRSPPRGMGGGLRYDDRYEDDRRRGLPATPPPPGPGGAPHPVDDYRLREREDEERRRIIMEEDNRRRMMTKEEEDRRRMMLEEEDNRRRMMMKEEDDRRFAGPAGVSGGGGPGPSGPPPAAAYQDDYRRDREEDRRRSSGGHPYPQDDFRRERDDYRDHY